MSPRSVDVLLGSLGLTTALILAALVLGAILGGLLIGMKCCGRAYNLEPMPDSESLRVTHRSEVASIH